MRITLFTKIVFIIIYLALPSHADIYKFVDHNGTVHFTNIPQGKNYKKVLTESSSPRRVYDGIIKSASQKYDIDASIIRALITSESNWDTHAVSSKGAKGLMQLMPSTARDMNIDNPFDPAQNIEAGTRYLRTLLDRFKGDLELAIAAYNAGPTTVEISRGIPSYPETQKFVQKVLRDYQEQSDKEPEPILKIAINDGTYLYTNIPYSDQKSALSNF